MIEKPSWQDADSSNGRRIFVASVMMGDVFQAVKSSTIFVSAFAEILGKSSVNLSDTAFEKYLANLADAIRMVRANAQSKNSVKS